LAKKSKRIAVALGLDGASWDLLSVYFDQGKLPVLKRLSVEGVHGVLKSVQPCVTSPAWKCYSTGKNPGKLGVFWWVNFDRKSGKFIAPNAYSFKSKDLWDYLNYHSLRTAIINMPTTYPPKPVDGIMISGFGAPLDKKFNWSQSYTFPKELRRDLEQQYDYKVGITNEALKRLFCKNRLVKEIKSLINTRFRVTEDLIKSGEYDFVHMSIFYINTLQHYFGESKAVEEAWEYIDTEISKLLEYDINLIIFSDHGHVPVHSFFSINNWLSDKEYLCIKPSLRKNLAKLVSAMAIPTKRMDEHIEWGNSDAVATSQGPVYLNKLRLGNGYEEFRQKLMQELSQVVDPRNGKKIIKQISTKEQVYSGPYLEEAPDIMLLAEEGYEVYGGVSHKTCSHYTRTWATTNHPDGIYLAYGPDISKKGRFETMSIVDIAPTILHLLNVPVPRDMDGKVKVELFSKDSEALQRAPEFGDSIDPDETNYSSKKEDEELKRHLANLGYL